MRNVERVVSVRYKIVVKDNIIVKKEIVVGIVFLFLLFCLGCGENGSGGSGGSVENPYFCELDEDCVVKNIGSCCGYYPRCVNADYVPDVEAVRKECEGEGMVGICGYPEIDECRCENNKCVSIQGGKIIS
ncbi:MAG: hypothetical protein KKG60_01165 [Nanoarchaeota archaeon]|nr:hypothetical protein [Nanoarchaeota archaeon]